jgi:hypothetical protein
VPRTTLWSIKIVLETDDRALVDQITDRVTDMVCPIPVREPHDCEPPWFVVTSRMPKKKARKWRTLLNR